MIRRRCNSFRLGRGAKFGKAFSYIVKINLNACLQCIPHPRELIEFLCRNTMASVRAINCPLANSLRRSRPLPQSAMCVGNGALNSQQRMHHLRWNPPRKKNSQRLLRLVESICLGDKRVAWSVSTKALSRVSYRSYSIDADGHDNVASINRLLKRLPLAQARLFTALVRNDEKRADDRTYRTNGLYPTCHDAWLIAFRPKRRGTRQGHSYNRESTASHHCRSLPSAHVRSSHFLRGILA